HRQQPICRRLGDTGLRSLGLDNGRAGLAEAALGSGSRARAACGELPLSLGLALRLELANPTGRRDRPPHHPAGLALSPSGPEAAGFRSRGRGRVTARFNLVFCLVLVAIFAVALVSAFGFRRQAQLFPLWIAAVGLGLALLQAGIE